MGNQVNRRFAHKTSTWPGSACLESRGAQPWAGRKGAFVMAHAGLWIKQRHAPLCLAEAPMCQSSTMLSDGILLDGALTQLEPGTFVGRILILLSAFFCLGRVSAGAVQVLPARIIRQVAAPLLASFWKCRLRRPAAFGSDSAEVA